MKQINPFVLNVLFPYPLKTYCLNRPYHLKLFKGCLPQILPGLFLNTLSHMVLLISGALHNLR